MLSLPLLSMLTVATSTNIYLNYYSGNACADEPVVVVPMLTEITYFYNDAWDGVGVEPSCYDMFPWIFGERSGFPTNATYSYTFNETTGEVDVLALADNSTDNYALDTCVTTSGFYDSCSWQVVNDTYTYPDATAGSDENLYLAYFSGATCSGAPVGMAPIPVDENVTYYPKTDGDNCYEDMMSLMGSKAGLEASRGYEYTFNATSQIVSTDYDTNPPIGECHGSGSYPGCSYAFLTTEFNLDDIEQATKAPTAASTSSAATVAPMGIVAALIAVQCAL